MSILDTFKLTGRAAVVTGAGQGLGRAIALAYAEAGADVAVAARRTAQVEAVADEIRALGRKALAVTADLRDPLAPARLASEAVAAFGKVDIWVNNAGGTDDATAYPLAETSEEHWREVVSLNMDAVWRCSKEAAKVLPSGGVIINMSSILAFKGGEGYGPYASSKAAINALTRVMSLELGPRNIRVNAIAPGPVPTATLVKSDIGSTPDPAQMAKEWGVALGRLGTPEDVAAGCLYLASPAASWLTGQVLVLAGGM